MDADLQLIEDVTFPAVVSMLIVKTLATPSVLMLTLVRGARMHL
jgi:hypothetical protein